jgi:hypothetical protein
LPQIQLPIGCYDGGADDCIEFLQFSSRGYDMSDSIGSRMFDGQEALSREIGPVKSDDNAVGIAIANEFASIPEIRHVMTEQVDGPLVVWIAIDDSTPEKARMRVYEKELELIDGFPEVDFDFNLVQTAGRDPREIAAVARVVYSR